MRTSRCVLGAVDSTVVCCVAWAMLALVTVPGAARSDELSDLEKAYGAYVAHRYEDAEKRLRRLVDAKEGAMKDEDTLADARMYLGAVLLAEGKKDQASAVFERLLLDKPDYQPDPLRVALAALDAVADARLRLRDKLVAIAAEKGRKAFEEKAKIDAEKEKAAARLATLETLAAEEVIAERHTRWEALLPFGVGQFKNGQPALGWSLLTTESLLAVGSAIGLGVALYDQALAYQAFENGDASPPGYTARAYEGRATDAARVGDVLALGFAAVALGGVVQAQLAFVPERIRIDARPRPVAPLSLSPVIGPAGVGVVGRF
jgi:tetratricopeptide (TPR) repeat protein